MTAYDSIATIENMEKLNSNEAEILMDKLREADIDVDEETFAPYKVVDRVRYDLEPMADSK